jgi:uncharacterized membrane protein YhaH (DUF805 family)
MGIASTLASAGDRLRLAEAVLVAHLRRRAAGRWAVWCLGYIPDFRGRIGRGDAWLRIAIIVSCYVLLASAAFLLPEVSPGPAPNLAEILAALFNAFLPLVILLSIIVRRLHDTGRNGWSMLVGLFPYGGPLLLIFFLLGDSQPGANEFGAAPR